MSKIDKAVEWAVNIANDDSHGYDQGDRWGPDYDCSSFLITAWENAGVPVKTKGASYTGDMVDVFKDCGFKDVTASINLSTGGGLELGDVLWVDGHTEMVYNHSSGLVGASKNEHGNATGGTTGDQTSDEIRGRSYYNYPWSIVLRYTGDTGSDDDEIEIDKSDCISNNTYLSTEEMTINAKYIYSYFIKKGWTIQAICGMLGNMQAESTINPGRWQSGNSGNMSGGYGLTQWTPATKITNYLDSNGFEWGDIEGQCQRIVYEFNTGIQYSETPDYPLSPSEFKRSTKSHTYLACAFAWNYEKSSVVLYGSEAEKEELRQKRSSYAEYWYNILKYYNPTPKIPVWKKRKFDFILFNKIRKDTILWINRNYHRR